MESAKEGKHFEIQVSKIHIQNLDFKIQLIKEAKSKDHMFPTSCLAHSKFKITKGDSTFLNCEWAARGSEEPTWTAT